MNSKSKNIALVLGFFVLMFLCYKLAVSKTIHLRKEYRSLQQEEVLFKNTPKQLSLLKQKQKYYDSILNKYQINGNSIQNNLLETITSFSDKNNLKIVGFLEPHKINNNDISVNTYKFEVEGGYNNILKLIYHLEQKTKYGEIINLEFEKKTDFRKNKKYLHTSVLLRSFG